MPVRHYCVKICLSFLFQFSCSINHNKKVEQSWQTSALTMPLRLARLVSMSVIFCLLPNSTIVILLFFYISEQHVWKLWVWIQFTGLMLPLWGTPVNNPITLISPVPWVGSIFCRWQSMRSSANFRTFFSESQNANPLDAELGPDFNAKWPFKVIQGHLFRCQWRATKGLHSTI